MSKGNQINATVSPEVLNTMEWSDVLSKKKKYFLILVLVSMGILFTFYKNYTFDQYSSLKVQSSGFYNSSPEVKEFHSTPFENEKASNATDGRIQKVDFDINGSDVLVFLHVQKTGGTSFGRQLVSNIKLDKECNKLSGRKRSDCFRPNSDTETWLFSRYSTGWACGLHADWTELKECVAEKMNEKDKVRKQRRLFYITILRDPVKRFISEWKHVQRGATWKKANYSCNKRRNAIPKCYTGSDWRDVSLDEFISCPYNMASNRQTRMMADLRLINCYKRWLDKNATVSEINELEEVMLQSAMTNLKELSFFGLVEQQQKTQKLFERTFPFEFKEAFVQMNVTKTSNLILDDEDLERIKKLNHLDVRLYDFAAALFEQRYSNS